MNTMMHATKLLRNSMSWKQFSYLQDTSTAVDTINYNVVREQSIKLLHTHDTFANIFAGFLTHLSYQGFVLVYRKINIRIHNEGLYNPT